eukprot:3122350-Prymnesium_polylepis.1
MCIRDSGKAEPLELEVERDERLVDLSPCEPKSRSAMFGEVRHVYVRVVQDLSGSERRSKRKVATLRQRWLQKVIGDGISADPKLVV